MLNLQWRLQALDPEASESLRVIAFFDALTESNAGVESLLRAAAMLGECSVGLRVDASGRTTLADSTGRMERRSIEVPRDLLTKPVGTDEPRTVFLDRAPERLQANDELLLERLGLALRQNYERSQNPSTRAALEILIDTEEASPARYEACTRLKLDPHSKYRIEAMPFDVAAVSSTYAAAVFTPRGLLRVELRAGSDPEQMAQVHAEAGGGVVNKSRRGVGYEAVPNELPGSFTSALAALGITSPRRPRVSADEFNGILESLSNLDPDCETSSAGQGIEQQDATRFIELLADRDWARETIDVWVEGRGVRESARALGVHHSTLQQRVAALSGGLGYDIAGFPGSLRVQLTYFRYLATTQHF